MKNSIFTSNYDDQLKKPTNGICVDGSTVGGNPGLSAYKIVDLATRKVLIERKIGIATNNHAEFIGLCHAIEQFSDQKIYSDSATAISWVKKKRNGSKFFHPEMELCLNFLKSLKKSPNIEVWRTKLWGENLADFGNK